jgi:CheY-like chemotaxis protein
MLHKGRKILVVDDERTITYTLAAILAQQGFETATSYSGEEAVEVALSFKPDFIVSDVVMGAMNGIEAAVEILRFLPQCKVLLVSGNAGYQDFMDKATTKGFKFEILLKPVHPLKLLEKISQMLARPADEAEVQQKSAYPQA